MTLLAKANSFSLQRAALKINKKRGSAIPLTVKTVSPLAEV